MKILVVCQFYYPENFTITNICEKLASLGHDVTVLTGLPNYGYGEIIPEYKKVRHEEINGVHVERVKLVARKKNRLSIIKNYLSFWKNSKKWVKKTKEKFDIVYSMSLSPVTILSAGNLYKKKHHVKHVVHCVDLWPESVLITHAVKKNSIFYKILYKWSRKLYEQADEILVGSPSFENYFREVLKLDNKILYVPQPSLVTSCDETFDFGSGFHILYCGNLGLIQQIPYICEAMSKVQNKDVIFHIIGLGPMADRLQQDIIKYGLENRVKYYGPIPAKEAAKYFKGCDALYVPLKADGYVGNTIPNKLVMSMAFAKPILAMVEGDGKLILEESKGAIFAKQNADSLAESIDAICKLNNDERQNMGIANQNYFQNHFTIDIIGKKIENELLDEIN